MGYLGVRVITPRDFTIKNIANKAIIIVRKKVILYTPTMEYPALNRSGPIKTPEKVIKKLAPVVLLTSLLGDNLTISLA